MSESIVKLEILDQPNSLISTLSAEGGHAENLARRIVENNIQKLYFVGCGSSFCVSYLAKYMLDALSTMFSDVFTGYEFIQRLPMNVDKNSYVILTSFSGETEDIIEALNAARSQEAYIVCVTNTKGSTLYREADEAFLLKSFNQKPMIGGYTTQVALLYWLTAHISKFRASSGRADKILEQLKGLPQIIRTLIKTEESKMENLAKKYKNEPGFYVISSGPLYSLAYKLAMTMLTENVWMHGCVVHSGEFRHGLIEKVERNLPMIFLLGYERQNGITKRVLKFVQGLGAKTIVFDAADYPVVDEMLTPLTLSIPVEWFIYYLALVKRRKMPEFRRYMGKTPF